MTATAAEKLKVVAYLKESYGLGGSIGSHMEGLPALVNFVVDYLKRVEPTATKEIHLLEHAAETLEEVVPEIKDEYA